MLYYERERKQISPRFSILWMNAMRTASESSTKRSERIILQEFNTIFGHTNNSLICCLLNYFLTSFSFVCVGNINIGFAYNEKKNFFWRICVMYRMIVAAVNVVVTQSFKHQNKSSFFLFSLLLIFTNRLWLTPRTVNAQICWRIGIVQYKQIKCVLKKNLYRKQTRSVKNTTNSIGKHSTTENVEWNHRLNAIAYKHWLLLVLLLLLYDEIMFVCKL